MIKISLIDVAQAVNGKLSNDKGFYIDGVSIDSRENLENKLFVPLLGKNRDGHEYIENAFENGAICTLSEKVINLNKTYILVESTFDALKDLAEYYISLFDIVKVAVTGSSGKTTTKDLIASILSEKYKVLKTEGNFNNEIGLPLTVFNLDYSIEVAVFEMGMNNFSEIRKLSKIIKPDICLITNIGVAHIENLGSREGILKAKCEIFDYMVENGKIILNYDDDMLIKLKEKFPKSYFYSLKIYNSEFYNFFYVDNIIYNGIYGSKFDIVTNNERVKISVELPGKYMIYNILAAYVVAKILRLNIKEIKCGINKFKSSKNRMEIIKLKNFIIMNDVYNSNPVSVKVAIDTLCFSSTRKVCILGDMLELGEFSEKMHFDIGCYTVFKKIDVLIFIGEISYNMYLGALDIIMNKNYKNIKIVHYSDKDIFLKDIYKFIEDGDTILVKASRGMNFEYIIENLMR